MQGDAGRLPAKPLSYALITPARNEARTLARTIESVVNQTVVPLRYIVVSDGSTDATDDIVKSASQQYEWIQLVRLPERQVRHFAGKVHAFNAGLVHLEHLQFDVLGSLDADITFGPDYFEFLLTKFAENASLGVAGTPFREGDFQYDFRFSSTDHVSGACQLFRRKCFEDIGGYLPIKEGGIDLVAVVSARMKGWQTRTFTEKFCLHHRRTQSGQQASLSQTFRSGYHDYLMGSHPVWQVFRSMYQLRRRPIFIGGLLLLTGYMWALVKHPKRPIGDEFVRFRRNEQLRRLRGFISLPLVRRRTI